MYKRFFIIAIALMIAVIFSGCTIAHVPKVGMVKQLNDKTVGVITGTTTDTLLLNITQNADITYYETLEDAIKSLKEGKIDAFIYDEPVLKGVVANNSDLTMLNELINNESYAFAVKHGDENMLNQINLVINILKEDGTYDEIIKRWVTESNNNVQMPKITLTNENGILTFGTVTDKKPFSHMQNDGFAGLEIEIAQRIAKTMGKDLKIVSMDYNSLFEALSNGEVDFIGAGIRMGEEQSREQALFSNPTYEGGYAVLVKSK